MEEFLATGFEAVLPLLVVIGTVIAIAWVKSAGKSGDEGDAPAKVFLPNLAGEEEDFNPANPASLVYDDRDDLFKD